MFTRNDINKDEVFNYLNKHFSQKFQIINIQNIVLQIRINEIRVDFVKYDYNLIEDVNVEDGIRYLGKKDISAMKLMAVANRGDQAKDFVDIYYLLNEISLNDMFKYYKQKYNQTDINPIKRSLVYFDDITDSNWAAVRFLKDKVSVENIKSRIIAEMNKYMRKKLYTKKS